MYAVGEGQCWEFRQLKCFSRCAVEEWMEGRAEEDLETGREKKISRKAGN
jgi:hypothetical protein